MDNRCNRVDLRVRCRRPEQREQRRDAIGINNRLAVVLRRAREVGEGRGGLLLCLLRSRPCRRRVDILKHLDELLNNEHAVCGLERELDERALRVLSRLLVVAPQ